MHAGADASAPLLSGAELASICTGVEAYYAARLSRHGATPLGVDWSCTATQWLRFVQLLKICPSGPLSLIDLGCGYGELATFLTRERGRDDVQYLGIDLSPEMVRRGRRRHRGNPNIRFVVGRNVPQSADFVVASGIMNVMLEFPRDIWEGFIRAMLFDMHRMSRIGFAVNFVKSPSAQSRPNQLYCTSAGKWAVFCEREFGRSVEILDDYGLQEFTLLARTAGPGSSPIRDCANRGAETAMPEQ
jgi:SAM-dependent methyltransferase